MSKYVPLSIRGGSVAWSTPQASVILIDSGLPEPLSYVKVSWLYISVGAVLTKLVIEPDGSITYKAAGGSDIGLILTSSGTLIGSLSTSAGEHFIDVVSGNLTTIP